VPERAEHPDQPLCPIFCGPNPDRTGQRLAPDDPEALYLFYLSFAHEPNGPTKNAFDGLEQAYYNLPQYQELAMSYVYELLRAHDTDHAARILRRIAYTPHGGKASQWAQATLKDIEKKPADEVATSPGASPSQ
jgi:hypothetical protein